MQYLADLNRASFCNEASLPGGECTNANDPLGAKNVEHRAQVRVACGGQTRLFLRRQFVGRSIAAALLQKGQRAIIDNKMALEEFLRWAKTIGKEFPQSLAADFGAGAIKSFDGAARMLVERDVQ